jgi:hypothetical protein
MDYIKRYVDPNLKISAEAWGYFQKIPEDNIPPEVISEYCTLWIKVLKSSLIDEIKSSLNDWIETEENNRYIELFQEYLTTYFMQFVSAIVMDLMRFPELQKNKLTIIKIADFLRREFGQGMSQELSLISRKDKTQKRSLVDQNYRYSPGIFVNNPKTHTENLCYAVKTKSGELSVVEVPIGDFKRENKPFTKMNQEIPENPHEVHLIYDQNRNAFIWEENDMPGISEGAIHYTGVTFGSYVLKTALNDQVFITSENTWVNDFTDEDDLIDYISNIDFSIYDVYIAENGKSFKKVNDINDFNFKNCIKYTIKLIHKITKVETIFYFYNICLPFTTFTLVNNTNEEISGGVIELEFLMEEFEKYNMASITNLDNLVFMTNKEQQLRYDVISYSEKNRYSAFLLFLETTKDETVTVPPYGELIMEVTSYPE